MLNCGCATHSSGHRGLAVSAGSHKILSGPALSQSWVQWSACTSTPTTAQDGKQVSNPCVAGSQIDDRMSGEEDGNWIPCSVERSRAVPDKGAHRGVPTFHGMWALHIQLWYRDPAEGTWKCTTGISPAMPSVPDRWFQTMVAGMLCAHPGADRRSQEGSKTFPGCPQLKVVKAPAVCM